MQDADVDDRPDVGHLEARIERLERDLAQLVRLLGAAAVALAGARSDPDD